MIVNFTSEDRVSVREDYESQGYFTKHDHTNPDGSGYYEFILYVLCSIDKQVITADGIDSITISNIPNPSTVVFDENEYEVTDGIFEFTIDLAGDYIMWIKSDGYADRGYIINAS